VVLVAADSYSCRICAPVGRLYVDQMNEIQDLSFAQMV
jgi:hypothetical protein